MGARDLSHALSAVLLFAAAATGQGSGLGPDLLRVQDAAVLAERRAAFFERWEAATPERRASAARALERLRPSGRPLDAWPGPAELALAARVLGGTPLEDALGDGLARFADGVGLLVVPGVAEARAEGPGEPLVVRAHRVYPADLSGEVELALVWVGPSGEELQARREPFAPLDFVRGFAVYVRAPIGPAGTWWLVPEVHQHGEGRRGPGVPFELLASAIPAATGGPGSERWRRLRELGVRTADALGPEGWLAGREVSTDADPGVDPSRTAGAQAAATLLVVTARGESPESFGYGAIGARWRELARRLALALEVVDFEELSARLDARRANGRLFLLARGDGVSALHVALLGSKEPVDGLILSTSLPEPGPALPSVPVLLVGPDPERHDTDPARLTRVAGEASPFLTEPRLPEIVEPWLAHQLGE